MIKIIQLKKNLYDLAWFIVQQNHFHHVKQITVDDAFLKEVNHVYFEDVSLFDNSVYYIAIFQGKMIGSVKITFCNESMVLPMEKLFGIKYADLPFKDRQIYQVGRLAISKEDNPLGISLFKQLLTLAIFHICKSGNSVMVAECDKKLLKGLELFGIKAKSLGKGIEYLGSETIPVYAKCEWLERFLIDNVYIEEIRANFFDQLC